MENPDAQDPRLEAFLSRLEGVKKQGGGWMARCPAHTSVNQGQNLAVGTGRSGILVMCHSHGCTADQIRKAMDLPWSALFWEGEQVKQKNMRMDRRGMELESLMAAERLKGEANILATLRAKRGWAGAALQKLSVGWDGERLTIPVRDEQDRLHDVLRYDPLGPPKWKMLQGKGRSRIPWPRPEIFTEGVLWIVEGEGSVFSMNSIGLNAVSLPGSIGKGNGDVVRPGKFEGSGWHQAWARRFKAPRIACIPDCDDVGRALMMTASYDLRNAGCNVVVLDLGFSDGFDVGDYLRPARDKETRRQAREMLKMLESVAMRQERELPAARMELQYWYEWQTKGPRNWTGEQASVPAGPEPEAPVTVASKPSGEAWGWGDV